MDRAIPVSEQRRRKLRRIAVAVAIAVAVLGAGAWLGTQMIPTLDRKALIISEVDRGTIDVSVSATGRIVPAFEEIIVSPISSKILEVYAHSGDSVDVGTPLLRLDLQSAETDYSKALDEREIRRQQTAQLKANVETQLSDRRMQIEVKEMEISQLEAQLRNELYLDSLGSGTRDRVRQAETTLKTAQMQLSQLRQQYQNEQRVRQADLRMQQLQNGIFEKGLDEKRRTLDDAKIRSPRRATLTYINSEVGSTIGTGQKIAVVSDLSHFKAECEISDSHSERVRVGGAVILRIGKDRHAPEPERRHHLHRRARQYVTSTPPFRPPHRGLRHHQHQGRRAPHPQRLLLQWPRRLHPLRPRRRHAPSPPSPPRRVQLRLHRGRQRPGIWRAGHRQRHDEIQRQGETEGGLG